MNGYHKAKEKIDNNTPETYPHRVIFMEMMSDIPISSKGTKRSNVHISAKRRKNAAHFGKFKPADKPKWDEQDNQVTDVLRVQKHRILKRSRKSRK